METVDYIDLLNGSALYAGIEPGMASTDEFQTFRLLHSDRIKRVWEWRNWHDLRRTEKRYFRDLYAAQGYSATDEVYYAGPQKYYQALRTVPSNQAPATLSGTTWTTNLAYWAESFTEYSANEYDATNQYLQGNQVYYALTDQFYQLFAVSSVGNAPTDATRWGMLTAFDRYVAYAQTGRTPFDHAMSAWDRDPRNDGRTKQMQASHSSNGLQILDDVPFVWMVYRIRRPRLIGDVFDSAATYAVGEQVYFSSTTFRGNFYNCTVGTAAGESPATATAKWSKAEIPAQFETFLVHGAAADYQMPDGDVMVRDREMAVAEQDLMNQSLLHDSQIAHGNRTEVQVR